MSYDEGLAERVRDAMAIFHPTERRMFGGLAFMYRGHMLVGVNDTSLMARVGPSAYEEALKRPHVRVMDFTGRAMKGYVYVDEPALEADEELEYWLATCRAFVDTLPAK